ncbi:MAG: hypothetical protein ABI172_03095 [Ginsengibacter sp.]|jgi:hypothetical protein
MKKYPAFFLIFLALSMSSIKVSAQKRNTIPNNGFWVLVGNIHDKTTTTVQFYTNEEKLIYEEKITGVKFNLNRRKTLLYLKEGLEKAMIAWNEKGETLRDKNWVSVLVRKQNPVPISLK